MINDAVMQPERPVLPEFDALRHDAKARPMRRPRHRRRRRTAARPRRPALRARRGSPSGRDWSEAQAPIWLSRGRRREIGVGLGGGRPSRPCPRCGPGGSATSSGSTARRAGWRQLARPCGSRDWCRRRSRAHRRPSTASARADGTPSGVAVATVMALASRGSLAWASANQRANSSNGSAMEIVATPPSPPYFCRRDRLEIGQP